MCGDLYACKDSIYIFFHSLNSASVYKNQSYGRHHTPGEMSIQSKAHRVHFLVCRDRTPVTQDASLTLAHEDDCRCLLRTQSFGRTHPVRTVAFKKKIIGLGCSSMLEHFLDSMLLGLNHKDHKFKADSDYKVRSRPAQAT